MATFKYPLNEYQYDNTAVTCNATDNVTLQHSNNQNNGLIQTYPFYGTRTATNVTTGQTEYDTFLIIN